MDLCNPFCSSVQPVVLADSHPPLLHGKNFNVGYGVETFFYLYMPCFLAPMACLRVARKANPVDFVCLVSSQLIRMKF